MRLGGTRRLVWTTFTSDQVDLDLRSASAWRYVTSVVDDLVDNGVTLLRLDAVGYTGKAAGTSCFMTPETFEFMRRIREHAHSRGARVLVEVHGHHSEQIEIAREVDLVYDFALPPLVLHALTAADLAPLAHWIDIRPRNSITVLDTHDGIGVIDVGTSDTRPGEPGLLEPAQIDALVERDARQQRRRQPARDRGGRLEPRPLPGQLHVLRRARLATTSGTCWPGSSSCSSPGIPQIYYVGLLAGSNDLELLQASGVGRDVNRHHYTAAEIDGALGRPVVREILAALRLRRDHPAFAGTPTWQFDGPTATSRWTAGDAAAELTFDVRDSSYQVSATEPGGDWRVVLDSTDLRERVVQNPPPVRE